VRLAFNKPSRDGSGKANLIAAPGELGWGVLFELATDAWSDLDRWEPEYARRPCEVFDDRGRATRAEYYVYESPGEVREPYDWYLRHLLDGAREHALPEDFITALLRVRCRRD
jgi:hypothetical protein